MYRINIRPGTIGVLFAGTKKECKANLKKFKESYPLCYVEEVTNTMAEAFEEQYQADLKWLETRQLQS